MITAAKNVLSFLRRLIRPATDASGVDLALAQEKQRQQRFLAATDRMVRDARLTLETLEQRRLREEERREPVRQRCIA